MTEHLTIEDKSRYIYNLLQDESLYHPFTHTRVSLGMLESVAVLRFSITWLMKWYSADTFKTRYIQSQVTLPTPTKKYTSNIKLDNCFKMLDKNIEKYSLFHSALLFLLKTLYFRTGFGAVLSHSRYRNNKLKFIPEDPENTVGI